MQVKKYSKQMVGIIGLIVVSGALVVGMNYVGKSQDIRNFASENSCKKVSTGVRCSWNVTNSNDNPYALNNFYAKVQVEQKIDSGWLTLGVGPNDSTSLYVSAHNNGNPSNPQEGSVFIPDLIVSADSQYRCKVELVSNNSSIGSLFCGVQNSFISDIKSCPISGNIVQPIQVPTATPTIQVTPTRTPSGQRTVFIRNSRGAPTPRLYACEPPRTLGPQDGYSDNCTNGCNFIFVEPSKSCLSISNPHAKIRLLYPDGGSVDFDDSVHYSSFFFNEFGNPLLFDYKYSVPGQYDVALTCNMPDGVRTCRKRVVVSQQTVPDTEELTFSELESPTAVLPSPTLLPTPVPACIVERPVIDVELKIKQCVGC